MMPYQKPLSEIHTLLLKRMYTQAIHMVVISLLFLTACGRPDTPQVDPKISQLTIHPSPTVFNLGDCIDARAPTPNPSEISLFSPVGIEDHILGAKDAYVTILVYSDFQCRSCAQLAILLKSLVLKYPQDVRVVFRHFPLESLHDKAALSAQAVEAANLQGKFWEMHDFLFSQQSQWEKLSPSQFEGWIFAQSADLGLDSPRLLIDINSPLIANAVQKTWDDGQKIKLPGVPVIIINGEIIKWQVNLLDQLENVVLLALISKKQFSSCPPIVIDPAKQYTAVLKTSKGNILLKLFADKTPNTVNNFIFLAQQGWYDHIPFHHVISNYVVQTGDPSGTGLGGPGYFIPSEKNTDILYDRAGMVGMANSGTDTNGSQFFITLAPAPQLNEKFTIFGEVISGMDVLTHITQQNSSLNYNNLPADMLINVSIETK